MYSGFDEALLKDKLYFGGSLTAEFTLAAAGATGLSHILDSKSIPPEDLSLPNKAKYPPSLSVTADISLTFNQKETYVEPF